MKYRKALFAMAAFVLCFLTGGLASEYTTAALNLLTRHYPIGNGVPFDLFKQAESIDLGYRYMADMAVWWGATLFIGAHAVKALWESLG